MDQLLQAKRIRDAKYRRTKRGYLLRRYADARRRATRRERGWGYFEGLRVMPQAEFMEWAIADRWFNHFWDYWYRNGCEYSDAPTLDRIDTLRGYVAGNLQWIPRWLDTTKVNLWRWLDIPSARLEWIIPLATRFSNSDISFDGNSIRRSDEIRI